MSVAKRSKEIITLEPKIRYMGTLKDGKMELNFKESDENLDSNTAKLSSIQTPHILEIGERFSKELGKLEYIVFEYDKLKLFDVPIKEEIVTFATIKDIDNEKIVKTVSNNNLISEKGEKGKSYDNRENESRKSNFDNPMQNYMLGCIEFFKKFTISSIHINEEMIKSFWKKF